jgi:hypothetical protein
MSILKFIILLFLLSPITIYGRSENILNRITEKPEGLYEISLETNIYQNVGYLTPTFSYTTDEKTEYSFSIQNIPMVNDGAQTYEYDTYVGITQFYEITSETALLLGTINGISFQPLSLIHNFDFVDLRWRPYRDDEKYVVIHGGPYFVNKELSTYRDEFGYQVGIEAKYKDLTLNLDYVSGHSNISGAVAILNYKLDKQYNFYTGVGVPESNSGNEFYGILGFRYEFR